MSEEESYKGKQWSWYQDLWVKVNQTNEKLMLETGKGHVSPGSILESALLCTFQNCHVQYEEDILVEKTWDVCFCIKQPKSVLVVTGSFFF